MKKNSKKFLGLLMVFALFAGILCIPNQAKAYTTGSTTKYISIYDKDQYAAQIKVYIEYKLSGSTATITKCTATPSNSNKYFIGIDSCTYSGGSFTVAYSLYLRSNNTLVKSSAYRGSL